MHSDTMLSHVSHINFIFLYLDDTKKCLKTSENIPLLICFFVSMVMVAMVKRCHQSSCCIVRNENKHGKRQFMREILIFDLSWQQSSIVQTWNKYLYLGGNIWARISSTSWLFCRIDTYVRVIHGKEFPSKAMKHRILAWYFSNPICIHQNFHHK